MTRSRSLTQRLDDLLFGPEAPTRLLAVQGLFLVLISVRTILSPYPKLAGAPAALFKPAWIVNWLDEMPSRTVIVAVQLVIVAATVAWFVIGRNPQWRGPIRRTTYAIAWLGFLFLAALRGSRGKIFHIELLLVWAALPLVFAPGDARWSDRRPRRRYGWTIRTAIAVMAVIYCMTGIWKLRNSGVEWVFSDNMKWSLAWGRVRGERPPLGDVGTFLAYHTWMTQVFAAFILLFELTFPLVVFFRRIRPLYIVAAWCFHLGTLGLLGLDYMVWPCTVTILLVDWPAVADRVQRWRLARSGSRECVAMSTREYDAVIVGAGPNGLTAAIFLARAGRKVVVFEANAVPGGGCRSAELTEPGFVHDVCSSVHPTGVASPAFAELPLANHGVAWAHPEIALAHPLDGDRAGLLYRSLDETATGLGPDADAYRTLMRHFAAKGLHVSNTLFSPIAIPRAPVTMARFGLSAIGSVEHLTRRRFQTDEARALFAGSAADAMVPLNKAATAGYGLFLNTLAHSVGWPVALGGSQRITDALVAILTEHGSELVTDHRVTSLDTLPRAPISMLDVTPRQLLQLGGDRIPARYQKTLRRYRYGPGVFKVDWALSELPPWTNPEVARAGTVHLGGTIDEIAASEAASNDGRMSNRPFVIFVQPTVADPSRAPAGKHVGGATATCRTARASTAPPRSRPRSSGSAPGFRDTIISRHTMNAAEMEAYDANCVGGDINGGAGDLRQAFTRPSVSIRPWITPMRGVYLCSSATPPGGGVHGMCGWHAAKAALRRHR